MADAYTPLDATPYPLTMGAAEDIVESGTVSLSLTADGTDRLGRGEGVFQFVFSGTATLEAVGDVTEDGLVVAVLTFDGDSALGTDGTATFVITNPDSAELGGRFRVRGFLEPVGDRDDVQPFTFAASGDRTTTGDFLP